jgi:hypothetical protein
VDLEKKATCRLADLKSCRVCVGGGIQLDSLDNDQVNRASFQGFWNNADLDDEDESVSVTFCFCPNSMWLSVWVYGWPREEWESVVTANNADDEDYVDADDVMDYLVDTVGARHPNATVEFQDVSFVVSTVHGALQRLLPAVRKLELDAERGEDQALFTFQGVVAGMMRHRGNENVAYTFVPQLNTVMSILQRLGIRKVADNHEMITFVLAQYEELGDAGTEEIFRNSLLERIRQAMTRNQSESHAAAGAGQMEEE